MVFILLPLVLLIWARDFRPSSSRPQDTSAWAAWAITAIFGVVYSLIAEPISGSLRALFPDASAGPNLDTPACCRKMVLSESPLFSTSL